MGVLYSRLRAIYVKAKKDPKKLEYMDLAMTPVTDDEDLEMFHRRRRRRFLSRSIGARTPPRAKHTSTRR